MDSRVPNCMLTPPLHGHTLPLYLPLSLSPSLSSLPLSSPSQDNLKESKVMKKDKIELLTVRSITQLTRHPKQPHSFTLKFKGSKRIILNCDTELVCPDS